MDSTILENNQLITSNSNENQLEETCKNCFQPSASTSSIIKTNFSEKTFETILNNLKVEVNCDDGCNELEDFEGITEKLTNIKDIKLDQQDNMCEVASTVNEYQNNIKTDVDDSKSNLPGVLKSESFDSQITSMYSTPSTSYPMMKISKTNSKPHTCEKYCAWCNSPFRLFDSPNHIKKLRSIVKQKAFLKMQLSLKIESCICDGCWKLMEKIYKTIKPKQSYKFSKKYLEERYVKKSGSKNNPDRICCIHNCSKSYVYKMTVEQSKNIKQLFTSFEYYSFVLIEPLLHLNTDDKDKNFEELMRFPLCFCHVHLFKIDFMSSCQLCGNKINGHFNIDDWQFYETWSLTLIKNKIPLVLQPGMFICLTCKIHISSPIIFPAIDLETYQQYVYFRVNLRVKVYGLHQYNIVNICKENMSSNVVSSEVVPKMIKEESSCSTKITFADPLLTASYHFEPDSDSDQSEIFTSTDEQNIYFPKVEPKLEGNYDDQLCSFHTDSLNQSSYIRPELFYRNFSEGLTGILKTTKHVDNNKSFHFNCQLNNYENKVLKNRKQENKSRNKRDNPKITSVYFLRRPRRYNNLGSGSKDLEKEVVNPVSIKKKNAIEDGKILKKQRLIETQSSIENISTPKSYQNKSRSSDVDGGSLQPHSNSMKGIELNMNEPSIHVEKTYSLDPYCKGTTVTMDKQTKNSRLVTLKKKSRN